MNGQVQEKRGQEKVLTAQQQYELGELHRKVKGTLLQLESVLTDLDIPFKSFNTTQ